jgi:heme exporter protein A
LSVALAGGEALVVTGPNGAGKSTLLRVLAGLLRPLAGRVRIEGVGETGDPPGLHAHYLGHLDALRGALTAAENLAFWAAMLKSRSRAGLEAQKGLSPQEALGRLGLAHAADLPVAYLSAGQKRRAALARLLAARRPVWLLDEPTTALDLDSQRRFVEFLREHLDEGGLAIVATHTPLDLPGARELRLKG